MDAEPLFLRRCEQAAILAQSEDEAELLDLAGLLRQMLLDSFKLMDTVNKNRIKPTFYVGISNFSEPDPYELQTFWTILDGLDPEIPGRSGPSAHMTRNQFLGHTVINHFGNKIAIKDIIKHCAEEAGGVHHDPRTKSTPVVKANREVIVKGFPIGVYHLKAIAKVMLRGLQPIIDDVQKRQSASQTGAHAPSPNKPSER